MGVIVSPVDTGSTFAFSPLSESLEDVGKVERTAEAFKPAIVQPRVGEKSFLPFDDSTLNPIVFANLGLYWFELSKFQSCAFHTNLHEPARVVEGLW